MLLTSAFYILLAFFTLFLIFKFKAAKPSRMIYQKSDLLTKSTELKKPNDWQSIPNIEKSSEKEEVIPETLESFILKEIEMSVKELDQKRIPFSNIDMNVFTNKLNPTVDEFMPKTLLNPHAQDFYPY